MSSNTIHYASDHNLYETIMKNKLLPNISKAQDANRYQNSLKKSRGSSLKNSPLLILDNYEASLKKQNQQSKMKEYINKQKRRYKTLEAMQIERRISKKIQSNLSSELEQIKYRLKHLNLERQNTIQKKQKMILLKSPQFNQHNPHRQYQHSPQMGPCFNPMMQNPFLYNPYNSYSYTPTYRNSTNLNYQQQISTPENSNRPKIKPHKRKLLNNHSLVPNTAGKPPQKKSYNRTQFKKRIKDMERYNNRQANIKRMKKCFLAAYFCVCLKKINLKIIQARKKFFLQFWPSEFSKFQSTFMDYLYNSFFPFFKLLKEKQYTNFLPQDDDTKLIKKQKNKALNELIKIFFAFLKPLKDIENLGKVAWSFCSNRSFVQKGVLTVKQLDFLCFNQTYGYLKMDANLQKSQIITFIFLKLIVFKFLLHPHKKWPKQYNPQQNPTLTLNLKLIASLFYDILVQIQEQYLNKVNIRNFPMGNYGQVRAKNKNFTLELSGPLLYQTKEVQDEIISGLYSQQFLKENVKIKNIQAYIDSIKEVVEGLHKLSKQYDSKFRTMIHNSQNRPKYKY